MISKINMLHGGVLDVLVSNHGINNYYGNMFETPEKEYDDLFNVNTKSSFFLVVECLNMLKKSKKNGGLANVALNSSITARKPDHKYGVYASSKAALETLAIAMSQQLLREGIRVNAFAPGLIETAMTDPLRAAKPVPAAVIGRPDQIASVVATLCSADGSFMNGEVVHANGGFGRL
jgi:3-oxoacyl-[acyl-carrier protein] reductase